MYTYVEDPFHSIVSPSMIEDGTLEKIPLVSHVCKNVKQSSILSYHARHMVYWGSTHLQQPYKENEDNIIGRFFFHKDDNEDKEVLYRIWQERCREMKKSNPTKPHPSRKPPSSDNLQPRANWKKIKIKIHWRADTKAYLSFEIHRIALHNCVWSIVKCWGWG